MTLIKKSELDSGALTLTDFEMKSVDTYMIRDKVVLGNQFGLETKYMPITKKDDFHAFTLDQQLRIKT